MARRGKKNKQRRESKKQASAKRAKPNRPDELPPGALLANPSVQVGCSGWTAPYRYYLDRDYRCVDCGVECTLTAEHQKWWYETLRASVHVHVDTCLRCRRARRQKKVSFHHVTLAVEAYNEEDSPETRTRVVKATWHAREHVGIRALERAMGWARKLPNRRNAPVSAWLNDLAQARGIRG